MNLEGYSDPVYDAIRAHVTTQWTACPVRWPNEAFDEVNGVPWVAMEIFGTMYAQESIGAAEQADNRWDEEGVIYFHVFVPQGRGLSRARGAAKALADLFRGQTFLNGNLEFLGATIGPPVEQTAHGNSAIVTVSIDWRYMAA